MTKAPAPADFGAQLAALQEQHPEIYACLDPERLMKPRVSNAQALEPACVDDFGTAESGGRGESYVAAQRATSTRASGVAKLLDLAALGRAESNLLVDLLGGDGLVRRVAADLGRTRPTIVTCDASPFMVRAAWERGIPAICQRAEASVLRDSCVGAVLLAYGTHHIPEPTRPVAIAEAFRVLQPGGTFVLHDFQTGSPVDEWFTKVVDVYSATGHAYAHFGADEIAGYLTAAGFIDAEVRTIADPFITRGATENDAQLALGRYLIDMYGLVGLMTNTGPNRNWRRAFDLAEDIFRYKSGDGTTAVTTTRCDERLGDWFVTMPREALVGIGYRPTDKGHRRGGTGGT